MALMKYPPRSAGDLCARGEIPRPVFGLDIDGTLGLYHEHFHRFAEDYLGQHLPSPRDYTGGSFASHLGLSKGRYRKIKLAYRRGGLKRSMPAILGADSLAMSLRRRGAVVVLCTTRPYLSVENIDEDTRHWAQRNRVQNDGIIWGPHKYRDLVRTYGLGRIVGVLEDEPELYRQALDLKLPVVAHARPYNVNLPVRRDLNGASIVFHDWLDVWEMNNAPRTD